ncbi:hypothetical protein B9G69_012490 [Bdellovibrio sp. SKB1291214]|nr:hypothetical protein [Bdellovibrio sp. SKB1291214]UYL07864.1 hypothetical protein B9G69_012490 [Bdellovibrio sp. SKB1291214]
MKKTILVSIVIALTNVSFAADSSQYRTDQQRNTTGTSSTSQKW